MFIHQSKEVENLFHPQICMLNTNKCDLATPCIFSCLINFFFKAVYMDVMMPKNYLCIKCGYSANQEIYTQMIMNNF